MPQPTKGPRLGGSPSHQRLMLANLATSLFTHGKITTTAAKARRLRPYAERLITKAKRGDLHNRREIQKLIRDKDVVHRLLTDIGPFFATRDGGYTRITKTLPRKGDNAPMAVIELITSETVTTEADRARRVAGSRRARAQKPDTQKPDTQKPAAVRQAASEAAEKALDAAVATDEEAPGSEAAEKALESAEAAEEVVAAVGDDPYGEGSHAALADGGQPDGFPVKGNEDSKLYHLPGTSHYDRTVAGVWFADAETAEAAGFQLPPAQREKNESGTDDERDSS